MVPDATSQRSTLLAEPPVEVDPGIWMVRIPLHVRLDPVNAYVLRDHDGALTIFDTGIAAAARELWREALEAIGASPADVQRIVVSHVHPDHIGGSGPLHALTGAPLFASRSSIHQAGDIWGDDGRMESYFEAVREHLREHGLPDGVAEQLQRRESELVRFAVTLPPADAWQQLDEGDRIEAAGHAWRVRLTPGHSDGHLVLHDEAGGRLLAGDHLLERISPAVGRFPRHEKDPLARYMESLVTIAMVDPRLVLPGHGEPFAGAAARARALMRHHVERIDDCVTAVSGLGAATAYEIARVVFSHVFDPDEPDVANERFATTETLAHLERARFGGRVARERGDDGLVRYRLA